MKRISLFLLFTYVFWPALVIGDGVPSLNDGRFQVFPWDGNIECKQATTANDILVCLAKKLNQQMDKSGDFAHSATHAKVQNLLGRITVDFESTHLFGEGASAGTIGDDLLGTSWQSALLLGTSDFLKRRAEQELQFWMVNDLLTNLCATDGKYQHYFYQTCLLNTQYGNITTPSVSTLSETIKKDVGALPASWLWKLSKENTNGFVLYHFIRRINQEGSRPISLMAGLAENEHIKQSCSNSSKNSCTIYLLGATIQAYMAVNSVKQTLEINDKAAVRLFFNWLYLKLLKDQQYQLLDSITPVWAADQEDFITHKMASFAQLKNSFIQLENQINYLKSLENSQKGDKNILLEEARHMLRQVGEVLKDGFNLTHERNDASIQQKSSVQRLHRTLDLLEITTALATQQYREVLQKIRRSLECKDDNRTACTSWLDPLDNAVVRGLFESCGDNAKSQECMGKLREKLRLQLVATLNQKLWALQGKLKSALCRDLLVDFDIVNCESDIDSLKVGKETVTVMFDSHDVKTSIGKDKINYVAAVNIKKNIVEKLCLKYESMLVPGRPDCNTHVFNNVEKILSANLSQFFCSAANGVPCLSASALGESDKATETELLSIVDGKLSLALALASANNPDEFSNLWDSIASPVGTWKLKRKAASRFWSVTSYVGVQYAREDWDGNGVNVDGSQTTGIFAPVGIDFAFKNSEHGLYFSLLDFGALMSSDTHTKKEAGIDSNSMETNVGFEQLLSPGIYYRIGFSNSPFVWGIGLSKTPKLRSVKLDTNESVDVDSQRVLIFLAMDLTLLPLHW